MATQTGSIDLSQAKIVHNGAIDYANDIGASIPTNVSQLENDAGYIDATDIPTNLSEFNNDSSFATTNDLNTGLNTLNNNISTDITNINVTLDGVTEVIEEIDKAIVIDPDEPSIMVKQNNANVKITPQLVELHGSGTTDMVADCLSSDSTKVASKYLYSGSIITTEFYPRYSDGTNIIGNLIFLARSSGHFSIKKV